MNHEVTTLQSTQPELQIPESDLPLSGLPFFSTVPQVSLMVSRLLLAAWILLAMFMLDQLTILLFDYWLLGSLDFASIFWTNFQMGIGLFVVALVAFTAAIALPALLHPISATVRRNMVQLSLISGIVAGWLFSLQYLHYLLLFNRKMFGLDDPIFGNDISYYVVSLPAFWTTLSFAVACGVCFLISSVFCAFLAGADRQANREVSVLMAVLGRISTPVTQVALCVCGVLGAIGMWLGRYDLLIADNYGTAVFNGAQYVDITGFISTLVDYHVMALAVLGFTISVLYALRHVRIATVGSTDVDWRRPVAVGCLAAVGFFGASVAFKAAVMVRDALAVDPNEPVIQLEYIQRHIDSTRLAYGLDKVEELRFVPKDGNDPMPSVDELMQHPSLKNAPLWPGFVNYIEPLVDPQHADRVVQTEGDEMVYGPTMEVFRQQQMYRTYYKFLSVDAVRYNIDGEETLFSSSVRELPLIEPYPWLTWWGQRFFLFTHGHGMVMTEASDVSPEGGPIYASSGIPTEVVHDELSVERQAIYYGEGSSTLSFTNVREMKEFDYAMDEGRSEVVFPTDVKAGVHIDSLLKKLCIGWRSGQFFEVVFSRLLGPESRVHFFRMPMERLNEIAPFLYFDPTAYAVAADGKILWMVNAMTTTDRYPYSRIGDLGDKAVDRARWWNRQPIRRVNYVRDSVKATIDAYTGDVKLYKISDEPIISTWAGIYPDLFVEGRDMPQSVREHMQYPMHMFHLQFDDLNIEYHMKDAITFFNMEDRWDDADEVLGPIMDQGKSITF